MLNTNQSSKWNSWKYLLIVPVLAAFLLSFQVKTISLEKPLKILTGTAFTMDELDFRIDRNTSDEELKEFTAEAKRNDIRLKISKVKRNSYGEIIAIKVEFKDKYGKTGTTHVNGDQPIQDIRFFRDSNGLAGFGKAGDSRFAYGSGENADNEGDNAGNEGDNGDESETFAMETEAPEPPDAPEAPEVPEAPEAPEAPETDALYNKYQSNKVIVVTTKDGKTKKYTSDGKSTFSFDTADLLADIDVNDIASVKITTDGDYIHINGDAFSAKLDKDTQREVEKAMKSAARELKRAEPEIRRAMKETQVELERARAENKRSRNHQSEQSKAEMDREVQEARKEIAKAREEIVKAKAEMDKARAELAAERAKKK